MADVPRFERPIGEATVDLPGVRITDESGRPTWRVWGDDPDVALGRCYAVGESIVMAVAPGERIVIGDTPPAGDGVDLTHVRAALRLSGPAARRVLEHVCGLDLGDAMTPDGAAARTLVAGVATERARLDQDGEASYLLLMSRSFARSVHERLVEVAEALD